MFDKKLVLKIFEGFSIERWNDLVRPFDIVEMDKAAEKAVISYIIGKIEESKGLDVNWNFIIYGCFFDLLRKIALCDIKAPVQRMIREEFPEEYIKLNEWVIDQYRDYIKDASLLDEFSHYIHSKSNYTDATERILKAAHKYSSLREVEMLKLTNETNQLNLIEKGLYKDIQELLDLQGLQLLVTKQKPYEFLKEIEKLRFQTRWNQTPRVPKTSVLGHSFFVATLVLLMSRELQVSEARLYNNFFSALFHDLPEAVTRDIISPVKQATDHLPQIVKQIEDTIVERELVPLMDDSYKDEILYFTAFEFDNKIINSNGVLEKVTCKELNSYSSWEFKPVDGTLVRVSDHIAALIEADCSIHYGISSNHLLDGKNNILSIYKNNSIVNDLNFESFFNEFL